MDPELLTPVIKQDNQDYYIFEPTILSDHSICMPVRWFERSGEMYAQAWRMLPATQNRLTGWIVTKYDCIEISSSELAASFPYFVKSFSMRGLPDPTVIFGEQMHLRVTANCLTDLDAARHCRGRGRAVAAMDYDRAD